MAKAADIRAMEPAALDEYFAGMDMLAPLVGTLQRGVDGGLLVDMIADQQSAHVQALRPFFMASAANGHVVLLAEIVLRLAARGEAKARRA